MSGRVSKILVVVSICALSAGGIAWWSAGTPASIFQSALAAADRGNLRQLQESADALQNWPAYIQHAHLLRGIRFLQKGDHTAALDEFSQVKPVGELRERTLLGVGECLYRLQRFTESANCMNQLLADRPDHVKAHRWLAGIYYDLGVMDGALSHLTTVTTLEPNDYRAYRMMGSIHKDFEKYKEAIEAYSKSLDRDPPPDIRREMTLDLARSQIKHNQFAQALERLDRMGVSADAYVLRSECLWSLGRFDEAKVDLRRAKQFGAATKTTSLLEARFLLESDDPQAALRILENALLKNPHSVEHRYQLAQAYGKLGRISEFEAEMKRLNETKQLLRELTESSSEAMQRPTDAEIRDRIADLCEQLGMHEMVHVWRQAAESCRRTLEASNNAREARTTQKQ